MRFFSTAGPIQSDIHYYLPPLERFDKENVLALVASRKYFVMHAPRQTGKTSCMLALVEELNRSGNYHALYINVESVQAAREDVPAAMRAILNQIAVRARSTLKEDFPREQMEAILAQAGPYESLFTLLHDWSRAAPRPIVLVIDEIDMLIGDTLVSVLRQLRSGYSERPRGFPQSIILCGVRDVRDYRLESSSDKVVLTGGSAFNIKDESLRLGNFSREDIRALYREHTKETGQILEEEVFPLVWELTGGQPWLVNALAYEACFRMAEGKDRTRPITTAMIERARETLILRRDTHLDQLAKQLAEARVRRVIEPLLTGVENGEQIPPDDIQYANDLGLVTTAPQLAIANRIYQEVIPRELTWSKQVTIAHQTEWYLSADGRLELDKLLRAFQQYFRENSESWVERFEYKEAGPQLLMQAFLQRIVNGGGDVRREYGLGRGRTDLLITWPFKTGVQRAVIELKVARSAPDKLIAEGLAQTSRYMDQSGAEEGHLVIFDRRARRKWSDKIFRRTRKFEGRTIAVWGM
jgi:AAA+ ATPase superfamily predicted ATPase